MRKLVTCVASFVPSAALVTACNGDDAFRAPGFGQVDAGHEVVDANADAATSADAATDAAVAQCPLGADAAYFDDFPTESDLPSGACTMGTADCELQAMMDCGCVERGPVSVYRCSCVSGSWSCGVIDQGLSGCDACPDASTDAD